MEDFEFGLDYFLTDCIDTPDLNAFLDEADAVLSSVSSFSVCSVSTVSDTCRPLLAPSIKSCKLWCQARTLLLPALKVGKMSTSKLIHYFSCHPAAFGFWDSLLPDNITLNPASKRIDQCLSDFQTGTGAAAQCILDTEQVFLIQGLLWLIILPLYRGLIVE